MLFLYDAYRSAKIAVKDNSASNGVFWQIWDYYSGYALGGTATPTLQVSPASLNFTSDSGVTPISQNVTASTPAGSLAGLTVSGGTSWLTVTPAAFSGQSISIVNAISMANLAAATYKATITVSTTNAGSKTYAVSFVVARPAVVKVLTSMTVSPKQYTAAAGSPIGFNATCKDQSNNYFAGATIGWSASGGGTIGATSGLYTAAAAPSNGPHRIIATATAGGVTLRDTALLIVSRAKNASIHRRIDCGSNALLPTGWETDDAYVTGGSDGANLATVSTSGVCGAAPADVYRTIRTGSHSYLVPLTIQDPYTVRLHFVDSKDTLRHMAYSILGNSVLSDFSPSATAGAANKGLALDFPVVVQDTNGLSINCSATAGGSVFEAGIEIMRNILQAHTLLSPLGGEKYSVGQTVQIKWVGDTMAITQTYIELSTDNGKTYNNFTGEYGLKRIDMGASWGTYSWKIPDTLDTDNGRIATVSPTCRIRIRAYDVGNHLRDMSDSAFTISAQATAIPGTSPAQRADRLEYRKLGNGMRINAVSSSPFVIDIFAVSGERLHSLSGKGRCAFFLPKSSGVAIIRMKAGNGTTLSKATIE
jgi:hypothetical protein